jgi:hypothetical protein
MITSTKDTEALNALVFFVGGGGDGAIDFCLVFRFFDGCFVKVVIDGNSSLFRLNLAGMTSASDGSIGLIAEGVFFLIVLVGIGEFLPVNRIKKNQRIVRTNYATMVGVNQW